MLNRSPIIRERKVCSLWMVILVLLAATGYGAFRLDRAIAVASEKYVQFVCRQMTVNAINQAVDEVLRSSPGLTDNLCQIEYDDQGRAAAIAADTYKLNLARDKIVTRLNEILTEAAEEKHKVRFGALMGSYLFSFWDPQLEVNISPRIYTSGSIETTFSSAGINQTQFTVAIIFDVGMSTSIINYESRADINMQVPLAELILVGDSPNYYSR